MGYFDRSGPSMMEAATGTRLMFGLALLSLALGTATALPLEVAKSELDSTRDKQVTFVNYEGPQAVIESDAAIRGIGSNLATAIGKPEGRLFFRYSIAPEKNPVVAGSSTTRSMVLSVRTTDSMMALQGA